ncbi:MAG: HEAT repeat domain-containing protein [bacterium]|nr:HEAT repeat domain-containing protein [bacterium]
MSGEKREKNKKILAVLALASFIFLLLNIRDVYNKIIDLTEETPETKRAFDYGKFDINYFLKKQQEESLPQKITNLLALLENNIPMSDLQNILLKLDANTRVKFLEIFLPGKKYVDYKKNIKGTFDLKSLTYEILNRAGDKIQIQDSTWYLEEKENVRLIIQKGPLKGSYKDITYIVVNNLLCWAASNDGNYTFLVTDDNPEKLCEDANKEIEEILREINKYKSLSYMQRERVLKYHNNKRLLTVLISDKLFGNDEDDVELLALIGKPVADQILNNITKKKKSDKIRQDSMYVLNKLQYTKARKSIISIFLDKKTSFDLRDYSLKTLMYLDGKKNIAILKKAAYDRDRRIRFTAMSSLGKIGNEPSKKILRQLVLYDKDFLVRKEAISELRLIGNEKDIPVLKKAAKYDKAETVRDKAYDAVNEINRRLNPEKEDDDSDVDPTIKDLMNRDL